MEKRTGHLADTIGDKNFIQKKVPKTNKYDHVKSTLNTGKTAKNVEVISKSHFNN